MTQHATGTFDVQLTPQPAADGLGRLSIAKQFHGDLTASSAGEMLSVMTAVEGSAAYVAVEWVSGTLHGRRGAFALQHSGVMARGVPSLTIRVVPDSGGDELAGLDGTMTLHVEGDAHRYEFEYTLGESQGSAA